ncbi:MAG: hypothetical protein WA125_08000 [Desulfosporosinus sp.]
MTILEYISKIRNTLQTEKEYDKYCYIFKDYIQYLEVLLKKERANIKAVCQLAIAYYEDRRENEVIISLMEDALAKYEDTMSKAELCEILNNLAYIYEKELQEPEKAVKLLKRAISLDTPFINSSYALGALCLDTDIDQAEQMFIKVLKSDPQNEEYRYHLGYCQMKKNSCEQALANFEPISESWKDSNELSEKAYYCCALIMLSLGKKSEAERIANDLYLKYKLNTNSSIDVFELIDLHYILEHYEKVVGLFEDKHYDSNGNEYGINFDKDGVQVIFYSLHVLGYDEKCKTVLESKLEDITEIIENYRSDDALTQEEKNESISFLENDIAAIKESYKSVICLSTKPEISDIYQNLRLETHCYLIDCPRHYNFIK